MRKPSLVQFIVSLFMSLALAACGAADEASSFDGAGGTAGAAGTAGSAGAGGSNSCGTAQCGPGTVCNGAGQCVPVNSQGQGGNANPCANCGPGTQCNAANQCVPIPSGQGGTGGSGTPVCNVNDCTNPAYHCEVQGSQKVCVLNQGQGGSAPNPCNSCGPGTTCNSAGVCVPQQGGGNGGTGGSTSVDACGNKCSGGTVCNSSTGQCMAQGQAGSSGSTSSDPCANVSCGAGTVCQGGVCVVSSTEMDEIVVEMTVTKGSPDQMYVMGAAVQKGYTGCSVPGIFYPGSEDGPGGWRDFGETTKPGITVVTAKKQFPKGWSQRFLGYVSINGQLVYSVNDTRAKDIGLTWRVWLNGIEVTNNLDVVKGNNCNGWNAQTK